MSQADCGDRTGAGPWEAMGTLPGRRALVGPTCPRRWPRASPLGATLGVKAWPVFLRPEASETGTQTGQSVKLHRACQDH